MCVIVHQSSIYPQPKQRELQTKRRKYLCASEHVRNSITYITTLPCLALCVSMIRGSPAGVPNYLGQTLTAKWLTAEVPVVSKHIILQVAGSQHAQSIANSDLKICTPLSRLELWVHF